MRAWLLVVSVLAWGCSNDSGNGVDASTEAGDGAKTPPACQGDFDCPNTGEKCWWVTGGGCTLQNSMGICVNFTAPDKCAPTVACGCDGTTISVCGPQGYVDRPSNTAGACPESDAGDAGDAGVEAGADAGDAGDDGATDAAAE